MKKKRKYFRGTEKVIVPERMSDDAVMGDTVNGISSGAQMGSQLGSVIPGVGNLLGAGIGAGIGGFTSYISASNKQAEINKQNSAAVKANNNIQKYSTDIAGLEKKQVNPNYLADSENNQYAQVAEHGKRKLKSGKKQPIEIEGGEPVFRKDDKGDYHPVYYDEKGKKHEDGGIPIVAQEGDAIVTAKRDKGKKAMAAYKEGNQKLVKKIIDSMPEDKTTKKYQGGVNGIDPPVYTKKGGSQLRLREDIIPGTKGKNPVYTSFDSNVYDKLRNQRKDLIGKSNSEIESIINAERKAKGQFGATPDIEPTKKIVPEIRETEKFQTISPLNPNTDINLKPYEAPVQGINKGDTGTANNAPAVNPVQPEGLGVLPKVDLKRAFDPTKYTNIVGNLIAAQEKPEVENPEYQKSRNIIYNDRSNPARQANIEAQNLAMAQGRSAGGNAMVSANSSAMAASNAAKQRAAIDTGEVGRFDQTYNMNVGIDNQDIAVNTNERKRINEINAMNRAKSREPGRLAAAETAERGDINEQALNTKYDREFGYGINLRTNAEKKASDDMSLRWSLANKPEMFADMTTKQVSDLKQLGYSDADIAALKAKGEKERSAYVNRPKMKKGTRSLTVKTKTSSEKFQTAADIANDFAEGILYKPEKSTSTTKTKSVFLPKTSYSQRRIK